MTFAARSEVIFVVETFLTCVIAYDNRGSNIEAFVAKMTFVIAYDGARYSSVVRAFAHGAMGRRIDPSWGAPIELFLVPTSVPRLV